MLPIGIQLHGIQPYAELKMTLGDGRDYRMKDKILSLPLEKAGAYLVVVRGGDLLVTGMALRSDLEIEAQDAAIVRVGDEQCKLGGIACIEDHAGGRAVIPFGQFPLRERYARRRKNLNPPATVADGDPAVGCNVDAARRGEPARAVTA